MSRRLPRFRHRSLRGLARLAGEFWRRAVDGRFVPAKRVRRVVLNGRNYKRLTLPDSAAAQRIAGRLETFRHLGCFPELVAVVDAELLLEFVPGRPLEAPFDEDAVQSISRFFGSLYSVDRRRVATVETAFPDELERDLRFLCDVGVIDVAVQRDLAAAAENCTPDFVYVGWDYLDPLPRNFVRADSGRLVAIDVEALAPDRLLGSGPAKCLYRGAESSRTRLLAAIERESELGLTALMPFVELHFLAQWTKHAYLKGRTRLVDPARFDRFRDKASRGEPAAIGRP